MVFCNIFWNVEGQTTNESPVEPQIQVLYLDQCRLHPNRNDQISHVYFCLIGP